MFWVLPGALVVAAAILILFVTWFQDTGVSGFEAADGRRLFRAVDERMTEATAVSLVSGERRVTLERADANARWHLAESDGYPVRSGAVEDFLRSLAELRAAYVSKESSPSYREYGLNAAGSPPGSTTTAISVRAGGGEPVARAAIGHAFSAPGLTDDRGVFIRLAGDPRVWLADPSLSVPVRQGDWIDKALLDIPPGRVQRLALSGAGAEKIALARVDGELQIVEGLPDNAELKGKWVSDLLAGLFEQLEFEEARAAAPLPHDVQQVRVAVVETAEDVVYTLRLLSSEGDPASTETAAPAEEILATVAAAPVDDAGSSAARTAERFNARHDDWAYVLPISFVDNVSIGPEDITRLSAER